MVDERQADHVEGVLAQWGIERPDLDVAPMAVIGRLSIAARLVEAELRRTFTDHGLDAASFDVLATLRRSGEPWTLTPSQLMHSAMVTSGAITQRLDRLGSKGLITRSPDSRDGRGVQVTLTAEGRAALDAALPDHLRTEERLLAGLTAEQRDTLAVNLQALIDSVSTPVEPNT